MVELLSGPWGPLLVFLFRIVDVSLSTMRILLVVRGKRLVGPLLGFVEVLIWVMVVGVVIRNLGSPWHLIAYAAGFSTGTAVGMWIEGKLALGVSSLEIVCREGGRVVAEGLRGLGFGVTELVGRGRAGDVSLIKTVVRRRHVPRVLEVVETSDPDAFVAVQEDIVLRRGWLHGSRRR